MTPRELEEHFEDFYEDIFDELAKHGEIEGLNVCDNLADHLVGNVYVKFREEEAALSALNAMNGRYYQGRPIRCEFSPVTDFRESTCRQYEDRCCNRAGYCNFMHLRPIDRLLRRQLFGQFKRRRRDDDRDRRGRDDRGRDRSPRGRKRSRSRSREGGDNRDGGEGRITAKGMSDEERRAMFARWNAGGKGATRTPALLSPRRRTARRVDSPTRKSPARKRVAGRAQITRRTPTGFPWELINSSWFSRFIPPRATPCARPSSNDRLSRLQCLPSSSSSSSSSVSTARLRRRLTPECSRSGFVRSRRVRRRPWGVPRRRRLDRNTAVA